MPEPYDDVTFVLLPRHKISGMSGDEWRTECQVILSFKGTTIVSETYTSGAIAFAHVGALIQTNSMPIPDKVLAIEHTKCDQPGCTVDFAKRLVIKKLFSDQGERLHESEGEDAQHYRQFCTEHLKRGDCSREDSDDNYEPVTKGRFS